MIRMVLTSIEKIDEGPYAPKKQRKYGFGPFKLNQASQFLFVCNFPRNFLVTVCMCRRAGNRQPPVRLPARPGLRLHFTGASVSYYFLVVTFSSL
jgi:hypothetical protein